MELAIIIVCVLTLLAIENFITTHQKSTRSDVLMAGTAKRPGQQAIRTESVIDESPQVAVTYDDAERALTTRLLAGELDPATYRGGMAALAATEQRVSGVHPLRMDAADRNTLEQLDTTMPGLPQATLFAAVALAHCAATVEDLTRLLGLTTAQALRVVTTTAGNADRQI
jgi:hypothetical protein